MDDCRNEGEVSTPRVEAPPAFAFREGYVVNCLFVKGVKCLGKS